MPDSFVQADGISHRGQKSPSKRGLGIWYNRVRCARRGAYYDGREDIITKSTTSHHETTTQGREDSPHKESAATHTLSFRLIQEASYPIPQVGVVACRLWRVLPRSASSRPSPQYAIELCGIGQRRMRLIGRDPLRAREIAALLVRHRVTPCTLFDILEDLMDEDGDALW
jgi:hypothetical protein